MAQIQEQMAPIGAPVPVVHAVPVTLPLVGTITQLPEHTSTLATRVLKISQLLVVLEIVTAIVAIVQNNSATPMVLSFIIGARVRTSPRRLRCRHARRNQLVARRARVAPSVSTPARALTPASRAQAWGTRRRGTSA